MSRKNSKLWFKIGGKIKASSQSATVTISKIVSSALVFILLDHEQGHLVQVPLLLVRKNTYATEVLLSDLATEYTTSPKPILLIASAML